MPRLVRKRYYALKAVSLMVAIAAGHFLETHPTHISSLAETPVPLTNQG